MSGAETPLRVGIDATAAAVAQPTGVGLAIAHLVGALRDLPPAAAPELTVCYRWTRWRKQNHFLPGPSRLYHERFSWRLARRLDVFHGPDSRLPRFAGPALVATVHDLSARRPGFASERFRATREAHWARARERATLLVTYTAAVKAELVRELEVPPERIAVVPLAPTSALDQPVGDAELAAVAALTNRQPYVLCLGERSRRKNSAGAARAFALAGEALADHMLVFCGPEGRGAEELDQALVETGIQGRVVRPGYLPRGQVAALLQGAAALLFPSRYEGFGMPVLEAFRAGVPVVGSTAGSVQEVIGGAGLVADPEDHAGLGQALTRAVTDQAVRAQLMDRGRARLRHFTWERAARQLIRVYRAAASGEPAPADPSPAEPSPGFEETSECA